MLAATVTMCLLNLVTPFSPAIRPLPSCIQLDNVSKKYPGTIIQTLFSSVPKREYAIQNINLSLGHVPHSCNDQDDVDNGVIILEGRSASGKSTLLRLIAGVESPSEGTVLINGHQTTLSINEKRTVPTWMKLGSFASSTQIATPVIIDGKPDFDNSKTVLERIIQMGQDTIKYRSNLSTAASDIDTRNSLIEQLAHMFADILTISEEEKSFRPGDLSPSKQFLFGIGCCCMVSIAPVMAALENDIASEQSISIPYPILLFDELFDKEASSTVDKCRTGILKLIHQGSVVVSVTHRPMYFMDMASRCITLSSGKILYDRKIDELTE